MKDGSSIEVTLRTLDQAEYRLVYEIMQPAIMKGYVGSLELHSNVTSDSCSVLYTFSIPSTSQLSTDQIYDDFRQSRIPALKKLFKRPN